VPDVLGARRLQGSSPAPVVVFCQEGYTSSLAAAALQDLGLFRATDLIGGFAAWRDAGLAWAAEATVTWP
jgi:rhodanese-related sulfurtransferase